MLQVNCKVMNAGTIPCMSAPTQRALRPAELNAPSCRPVCPAHVAIARTYLPVSNAKQGGTWEAVKRESRSKVTEECGVCGASTCMGVMFACVPHLFIRRVDTNEEEEGGGAARARVTAATSQGSGAGPGKRVAAAPSIHHALCDMLDGTPHQMLDSMTRGRVLCLSMSNTCPPLSSCIFDPDIFPADVFDADLVQVCVHARAKDAL